MTAVRAFLYFLAVMMLIAAGIGVLKADAAMALKFLAAGVVVLIPTFLLHVRSKVRQKELNATQQKRLRHVFLDLFWGIWSAGDCMCHLRSIR